jgi:hypothetical protein
LWDNEKDIIDDMKNQKEGYVIAVDERRQQNTLHQELDDIDISFISKTNKGLNLDSKKICFTPKITEGVDIQPETAVKTYAIYQTSTINARTMYQQLTRNRKPTSLNICFLNNRCIYPSEATDTEIYEDYDKFDNSAFNHFDDIATPDETQLFLSMRSYYEMADKAYKSNPKKHLLKMLHKSGFVVCDKLDDTKAIMSNKQKAELNQTTMAEGVTVLNVLQTPEYERVNEVLKLPPKSSHR